MHASPWWKQKTKNLTPYLISLRLFTSEDISPSTVYFPLHFKFPEIFFCILEIFHILCPLYYKVGCLSVKSNFRQTYAAHGNLDSACSYSQRQCPVSVIQKIPVACWLLHFLYRLHFLKIFFFFFCQGGVEKNMTGTIRIKVCHQASEIMVASGLLGELTFSTPFHS